MPDEIALETVAHICLEAAARGVEIVPQNSSFSSMATLASQV